MPGKVRLIALNDLSRLFSLGAKRTHFVAGLHLINRTDYASLKCHEGTFEKEREVSFLEQLSQKAVFLIHLVFHLTNLTDISASSFLIFKCL